MVDNTPKWLKKLVIMIENNKKKVKVEKKPQKTSKCAVNVLEATHRRFFLQHLGKLGCWRDLGYSRRYRVRWAHPPYREPSWSHSKEECLSSGSSTGTKTGSSNPKRAFRPSAQAQQLQWLPRRKMSLQECFGTSFVTLWSRRTPAKGKKVITLLTLPYLTLPYLVHSHPEG